MKKNKIYKVTIAKVLMNLYNSFIIAILTPVLLYFSAYYIEFTSKSFDMSIFLIAYLFPLLIAAAYAIYPAYICWIYYKHDRGITICVDYVKQELTYIKDQKPYVVKYEDIICIVKYSRLSFIGLWYYKIVLQNEKSLIITSLLVRAISGAIPKSPVKRVYTFSLLLPKKEKEKKEEDDYFDEDNGWSRF